MHESSPDQPRPRLRIASAAAGLSLGLALLAGAAAAENLPNLYLAEVPAAGLTQSEQFAAGLADVLVRITGRRDAAGLPAVAPLLQDPVRYVRSYRRVAGGRLAIVFDRDALDSAVAAAGLPYWGSERPVTEVWLALDRGGAIELVTAASNAPERAAVEAAAAQRGLPLRWPAGSQAGRERLQQVWAGDLAALAAAAREAGLQGALVGQARPMGGSYVIDWSFAGAGGSFQARGGLDAGVHLAADRYAQTYASAPGASAADVMLTLLGVNSAADFTAASSYLGSVSAVRDLTVREVGPDSVVFAVTVRGDAAALLRALQSDRRLRPQPEGDYVFRWQP